MSRALPTRFAILLSATLALAACQSSEERAEGHYQDALELIAAGDPERGLVELRNVFDLNETHHDARALYAETLIGLGRPRDAYAQYLRLAEQYPDDLETRIALSQIAIEQQDWKEARRHGAAALALAPEDPAVRVISASVDYADAIEAQDETARTAAVARAGELSAETPEALPLRRILVDDALRREDLPAALELVEATVPIAPEDRSLYDTWIALLVDLGETEKLEATLIRMIEVFPEDPTIVSNLIRYYVSREEVDKAEAFLRARIAAAPPETVDAMRVDLVQLLLRLRSPEAALAELDAIIAAAPAPAPADADAETAGAGDPTLFQSLRARVRFDMGEREEAIAEMRALLEGRDAETGANDDRIVLAQMLNLTGDREGARALVKTTLDLDRTEVEALKLEAGWRIADDQADGAISLLRTALDEAPQDVDALTLMAQAHLRNGNRDLARDMLSLAVQASNSSAAETRRYVALLIEDGRYQLAEEVLTDALRVAPENVTLLMDLAGVHIQRQNWSRARQAEERLRAIDTPEAIRAADGVRIARLSSEGRTEEAVGVLEEMAERNSGDIPAQIGIIRARLMSNDVEGALSYVEKLIQSDPENLSFSMIKAATLSAAGQQDEVVAIYRDILSRDNQLTSAWIGLLRALYAQGEVEEADAALEQGLNAIPDSLDLLWAQASLLERAQDYDGALDIYAQLYERAPDQPVIANNYASLLSTLEDDPESLEKAYLVARRLRDTGEPAFKDTYGRILFLRGDVTGAIEYLEPAAEALPSDAMVQYHLGAAYLSAGRTEDAREVLERALEIAGDDPRPEFETARADLADLAAAPKTP